MQDETRRRRLGENEQGEIQALEQRKADLERHINENFNSQHSYWVVSGIGVVREISRIEVREVQKVQTTLRVAGDRGAEGVVRRRPCQGDGLDHGLITLRGPKGNFWTFQDQGSIAAVHMTIGDNVVIN